MKRPFTLISLLFLSTVLKGAVPSLQDFNTNQFSTTGGKVAIKDVARLTNTIFTGTVTLNGNPVATNDPSGAISNLFGTYPISVTGSNISISSTPFAFSNATYLLYNATNNLLPKGKALTAGPNIMLVEGDTNIQITATGATGTNGFLDPGANGVVIRVATNTSVARTITGTPNQVTVGNGDGVAGNPTLSLPQDIHTGAVPTFAGENLNGTLGINTGTLTLDGADANLVSRWNAVGTVFTGMFKLSLTDTAHAAGSQMVRYQVGAVDIFTFDPSGNSTQAGSLSVTNGVYPRDVAASSLLATDVNKKIAAATSGSVQTTLGNVYQATNANLTALQAYGPTAWQATNANLTALQAYGPTTWQATNGTLTQLSTNTITGTGRIALESLIGVGSGSVLSYTNKAAMEAATGLTDGTPVILKGYYVQGDAPSVIYTYVAGDTTAVDNGSVITNAAGRFKIQNSQGRIDIRNFGAISDWIETGGSWTNGSTNIVLSSAPTLDYVGKKIALRRGNGSVGATVTLQASDLSAGAITNFTVVSNGFGYINIPTNILSSGPGSGATTTVVLTNGRVSSITVTAGGSAYTTNSIFVIRSTDPGTTNAPYYTELFTVLSQSSSNLTVTPAPTFTANLNAFDDPSGAILYTDNATALQAACNYGATNGLEVFIPRGDFASGPVYVSTGQRITGGGRGVSRVHSAALLGITTFRKSVFAPNNINFSNGHHSSNDTLKDVEFSNFTLDGSAPYQSPMGTALGNGQNAVFGIGVLGASKWSIHDMFITNCQGGAVYLGSFNPDTGTDWTVVQSYDINIKNCRFEGNWRQVHQMGNVTKFLEENCYLLDSSRGYYETQIARNLIQGNSVGQNGIYSPEQLDAESNGAAVSGNYRFVDCWMQNKYGKAVDIFPDQERSDYVNCTFQDNLLGSVTSSVSNGTLAQNNQDWGGEWTSFQNCRFFGTSTNVQQGPHISLKQRGYRIQNCIFEGKTGNSAGDIVIDGTGYTTAPAYIFNGTIFSGNEVNLWDTDGSGVFGIFSVQNVNNNVKQTIIRNNNWLAARFNLTSGSFTSAADSSLLDYERLSGTAQNESYAYQTAAGGNPDYRSETASAGMGLQDFTMFMRIGFAPSASKNGELFRYGASREVGIFNVSTQSNAVYALQITWNPNFAGGRDIYVPYSAVRGSADAWQFNERPLNLALTRTHGAVYKINVTAGGSGYTASTTLPLTFASGAAAGSAQTSAAGVVTNAFVSTASSGYTTNPIVTLVGGGGSSATFNASAGRLDVWMDGEIIYTDYGTNVISTMSTTGQNVSLGIAAGTQGTKWYAYGIWNKALTEQDMRQVMLSGPAEADKWGTWNSTAGCLTYVKMNPGIGFFFEDLSANKMHLWSGQAVIHGFPKRSGQILKRIVTAAASTNSINTSLAASAAIPSDARITSIYAVGQSLGVPSVVVGFDAALANPITTAKTLVAGVTNYLDLVPAYAYGSTNRPVYISTSAASTNDYVINYSLDNGALDASVIQSGNLNLPGAVQHRRFAVSTNYTIGSTDFYIYTTAAQTNTLPTAASAGVGRMLIVKNSTGTTTVRPAGVETIDGVAGDDLLTTKTSHTYISDGVSNWELQ